MNRLSLLLVPAFFILHSCGESETVTNCKIHYCDIKDLEKRQAAGEDVASELEEKQNFLDINVEEAIEEGHDDIHEILGGHTCE
jgi:hypothetical protein